MRRGREGAPELLVECHALDQGHARSLVLLGQQQADEVELAELLPQRRWIPDRVVLHLADDLERAVARQQVAHRLAQELLLLVEVEIKHGQPLFVFGVGSEDVVVVLRSS